MGDSKEREAIKAAKRAFDLKSSDGDRADYIQNHFDSEYGKFRH